MDKIRRPCTTTTRRKIQNSQKSIAQLAKQYGITTNTVFKWKKRNFVHDDKKT